MIILGTNSIKDTGYDVANSARFTASSTGHMERTFDHAGNRKVWTFSTWIKRSVLGVERGIFGSAINSSGTNAVNAIFFYHTGDTVRVWTQNGETAIVSGGQFRDTSAWMHLVWTAQSSSPYYKVYVNGTEINYATDNRATYPSTNDSEINQNNVIHYIGGWKNGSDQSVSSYMADTYFLDGYTYDPSYFGETDSDSGIWKPKKYAEGNYGNNGFHLEYKETGTSANSSGMGADTSGNGNHFTPQNMTAEDISTDTPTNNFATLNPLIPIGGTFSEGNLQHTRSSAGYRSAVSSIGVSSGKWYVEIKSPDSENIGVGVINGDNSSGLYMSGSEQFLGQHSYDVGYYFNGVLYVGNSSQSGSWTSYTSNDIIGIAIDVDNGFVYFSKNGTFVNSGNPTSGSSGTGGYNLSGIGSNGTYFIGCSTGNNSEHYVNFGNPIFSISSGNTDADGYGNFEYAVPSGYYALNTKNLAEYG